MHANLFRSDDAEWRDLLKRCWHDCHQKPGWLRAAEHADGGIALAVHVSDGKHELLVPILRRELGAGIWDATSPYGYAGPVVTGAARDGFADEAMQAAVSLLRE
ncbi:hypothetical protein [Cupriavidus necator]|uniref:hypothetical protein n=1 Tax=Cupriavidus necator TaxID=106590 RepID=UPI001F46AC01|nr:hypothetical protein [Cupriavidus necator]